MTSQDKIMANQNLIDRLNLEREITELTRERSNISKQAEKDMQNRASLLQKIVSAEGDNVQLGHAQKDLRKKSNESALER